MGTTKSARKSKRETYTVEQLESVAAKLHEFPPIEKKELTKQEAVKFLSKEIRALEKKGYSLEQISAALSSSGLTITVSTLKNYLRETTRKKKGSKEEQNGKAEEAS